MGIGISVLLIAAGAILTFAVDATVQGVNIHVVGVILMVAGAIGLVTSLILFAPRRRRDTLVRDEAAPVAGRTTTTREY